MFAHAVENNHGLVDGIAENGKHRREHRKREFPVHYGEDADHDHHVVEVGDDGGHRELPFESEGQVDHDAEDHERKRRAAVAGELIAHLRADELRTLELHAGSLRRKHLHDFSGNLAGRLSFLGRNADHDVARRTEGLNEHLIGDLGKIRTDLLRIGRFRIIHLKLRAARELN